jgi:hypothetical protein
MVKFREGAALLSRSVRAQESALLRRSARSGSLATVGAWMGSRCKRDRAALGVVRAIAVYFLRCHADNAADVLEDLRRTLRKEPVQ